MILLTIKLPFIKTFHSKTFIQTEMFEAMSKRSPELAATITARHRRHPWIPGGKAQSLTQYSAREKCKLLIVTRIAASKANKASLENKMGGSVVPHLACTEAVCFPRSIPGEVKKHIPSPKKDFMLYLLAHRKLLSHFSSERQTLGILFSTSPSPSRFRPLLQLSGLRSVTAAGPTDLGQGASTLLCNHGVTYSVLDVCSHSGD